LSCDKTISRSLHEYYIISALSCPAIRSGIARCG
jgi:hypothetical protein